VPRPLAEIFSLEDLAKLTTVISKNEAASERRERLIPR